MESNKEQPYLLGDKYLVRLLENRHSVKLQWADMSYAEDPSGELLDAYITVSATVHDCINIQRYITRKQHGLVGIPDINHLTEFIVQNYAMEVDDGY